MTFPGRLLLDAASGLGIGDHPVTATDREDHADAADLARLAVDYGADYVGGEGRPLRWSPTVVELFMCDYLPRKVLRESDFFERAVLELVGDDSAWVPSKAFLAAAREASIDIADPATIEAYVEQYNRDLAA